MNMPIFAKPLWLERFHAYLRARPVRRAVIWVIGCLLLFQLAHFWWHDPVTPTRFGIDLIAWSAGGLLFYLVMRRWDATHAR